MPSFDPYSNNYQGVSGYGSGYDPYSQGVGGYEDPMGGASGAYGNYDSSFYGAPGPMDLYSQYRAMAYQNLQNPYLSAEHRQAWTTYLNELNGWFQQYGGQAMGWDPLNGNTAAQPTYPISYQDQTRIVTDEGPEFYLEVNRNDSETRTIEAYQQDGTIVVSSNSATINVSETTDARGKAMKVVQITYEDGKTRTVHFYGENLTIKAANPDNVVEDASVTSGLTVEGLDEESFYPESSISGVKQADGSLLYDAPSIDFAPKGSGRAGQNQVHDVYGDLNLTVPNTSSAEVQPNVVFDSASQTEKRDGYKIIVTHRDGSKDTFIVHKGFKINLTSREDSTKWMGTYEDGYQIRLTDPIEYSEEAFPEISFNDAPGSASNDGFLNGDHPEDTQPDDVQGDKAYYNTSNQVEITASFNGKEHHITTPGEVVLHKSSYADSAEVTKEADGKYKIVVKNENGDTETFYVDGASKITLDFMPEKVTGSATNDPVIQKGGNDLAGANQGDTQPTSVENNAAHYDMPAGGSVTLHANHDDGTDDHYVNVIGGTVDVYTESPSDTVYITKRDDGTYEVAVYKETLVNGVNESHYEKFIISGPPNKINIHGMSITPYYSDGHKGQDYYAGLDPKISVDGEQALTPAAVGAEYPAEIDALHDFTGADPEKIIEAIQEAYPDAPSNEVDFREWLKDTKNWITNPPTKDLISVLVKIDPKIRGLMGNPPDNYRIGLRLVEDLKLLFPDIEITLGGNNKIVFNEEGKISSFGWIIDPESKELSNWWNEGSSWS